VGRGSVERSSIWLPVRWRIHSKASVPPAEVVRQKVSRVATWARVSFSPIENRVTSARLRRRTFADPRSTLERRARSGAARSDPRASVIAEGTVAEMAPD
jgi:hypothetical protein